MRRCTVCAHPDRVAIDAALLQGVSLRTIGGRHGISAGALYRHRSRHVDAPTVGDILEPAGAGDGWPRMGRREVAADSPPRGTVNDERPGARRSLACKRRVPPPRAARESPLSGDTMPPPRCAASRVEPEFARTLAGALTS